MRRHESLWQATDPAVGPPASGPLPRTCDVVVVGAGITGLTTALLLARSGASVTVLERHRVSSGTTGGTTAKVTALHGTTYSAIADRHGAEALRAYGAANNSGVGLITSLATEYGIACDLTPMPAVIHAATDDGRRAVEAEAQAVRDAGLAVRDPGSRLPGPDVSWAGMGDDPTWAALDGQAAFHPRRYCHGLAAAVLAEGGHLLEDVQVTDIEDDGGRRRVTWQGGAIVADHVVVATLLPFPMAGMYFAKTRPSRSYALSAELDAADAPHALYLGLDDPHRSVRPYAPATGPAQVIVEGESHVPGEETDTERHHRVLEEWARGTLGIGAVTYSWSAQDYRSVDDLPFVGPITSSDERVQIATGFAKWGMSNGSAAAIAMADRILRRDNDWAEALNSARSVLKSAPGAAMSANAEVAKDYASTHASRVIARGVDDLAPGEGDVVKTGHGMRAAFRDDDGTLVVVSPNCTHMGCGLAFNNAERSWDCPCHGSRFTVYGEVIEGPATAPLDRDA